MLKKIFLFNEKQTVKILAVLILFYTAIFFALCWWKYLNFGYDGLDLAIFNQVFFNTIHGNWFAFSIHPHSYLGDHAEFIILLLAPLYALWQSPLCLLLLQVLIISLCAWPLFLIARRALSLKWSFFIACLWLLNPFLHNMALFEFHILPFAMFTLLWMFYFWQTERFKPFLVFLCLSLLVREDVSLVVIFFGIFSWVLKRRQFKWTWLPFILGSVWFYSAMKIIGHFTPTGSYKYFIYYAWLGNSLPEIIGNILSRPLYVFSSIMTVNNLFLLTVLALFFLGINFLACFYLIPAIPILAQLVLGGRINSGVVLQTHYSSLLLVFWFISLIYGLQKIFIFVKNNSISIFSLRNIKRFIFIILLIITFYFVWKFCPITGFIRAFNSAEIRPTVLQQAIEKQVADDQVVVSTLDFLPFFSNRQNVYALYYVYLGHKQFSDISYNLPMNTEVVVANFQEALDYWILRDGSIISKQQYLEGTKNWSDILAIDGFKVVVLQDTFALLKKQASGIELYEVNPKEVAIEQPLKINLDDNLSLVGVSSWNGVLKAQDFSPLSFYFKTTSEQIINDYQFRLLLLDKDNKELYKKYYPLSYGLFPTILWPKNSTVKINYNFWLPPVLKAKNPASICWEFFKAEGDRVLNVLDTRGFIFSDYQAVSRHCLSLDKLP